MCAIVNKLPYKLREKWRSVAFDIQEKKARRPKFKDLVGFINTQAKVALHLWFGDSKDSTKGQAKSLVNLTSERKSGKTIFTTAATPVNSKPSVSPELKPSKKGPTSSVSAVTNPCLFCQGEPAWCNVRK